MAGRRFGLYFAWSRRRECGVPHGVLENRYPTLFEFRRAYWPMFEALRDAARFDQGVAGFLDYLVMPDFKLFHKTVLEATGHPVAVMQREGDKPPTNHLDEAYLKDIDTLILVSLDHFSTEQRAAPAEIEMLRHFASQEGKCLVICPHHTVGETDQGVELKHHGDQLVPSHQLIGGFARSVFLGLDIGIENRFALSPARDPSGQPVPLTVNRDLDRLGLLEGVTTFNAHRHLPHLAVVSEKSGASYDVLARQAINPAATPHPFVQEGNSTFNALIHVRDNRFGGSIVVCDSTIWSTSFGGVPGLQRFWSNLARLPM